MRNLSSKIFGIQLLSITGLFSFGILLMGLLSYLIIPIAVPGMDLEKFSAFTNYNDAQYLKAFKILTPLQTFFVFGFQL
jgi:hypothetical protein